MGRDSVPRRRSATPLIATGGAFLALAALILVLTWQGRDHELAAACPDANAAMPGALATQPSVQFQAADPEVPPTPVDQVGMIAARRPLRAVLLTALATAGTAANVADASAGGHQARPSDSLVDSIGVNVHLGRADTPYDNADAIERKLTELGVRHVRDGLSQGQPHVYSRLRSLAQRGIKTNLILGDPQRRFGSGTLDQQLALLKRELSGAVDSVEGPNEYDNQGDGNWRENLRDYQDCLYRGVKSDPQLRHLPVVGPSIVFNDSPARLGNIAADLDYGNAHPYPGGRPADAGGFIGGELKMYKPMSGRKPLFATETGYTNALASKDGHRPTSEAAAATYMPRLYLEFFRRGFRRTFSYEMIDEWPNASRDDIEAHFGLLNHDFSEKPAYTALKRMIGLLSDPGPRFKARRLRYSIVGAPAGLHKVLLQKRDGSFYLAFWKEDSVWDPTRATARSSRRSRLRLRLRRRTQRVEVYRPNSSARPVSRRSGVRSLRLKADSKVTIVKIAARARRHKRR